MNNKIAIILLIAFLPIGICSAHESERIEKLETELEELRLQVFILVASIAQKNEEQASDSSKSEKWQFRENWRKLEVGMEPSQVREILGEPRRADGGMFSTWHYQNAGSVTFHKREIYRWDEPLF